MHNDPANQSREEFEHYENLVMQTELLEPETDTRLAPLRKQDVAIAKMREEFMPLRVKDHTDERGVKAVHEARMVCVKTRTAVEKTRKELEDAAEMREVAKTRKNQLRDSRGKK